MIQESIGTLRDRKVVVRIHSPNIAAANLDVHWALFNCSEIMLSSMERSKKELAGKPSTMSIQGEIHTCYSFSYIWLDLEFSILQYKHRAVFDNAYLYLSIFQFPVLLICCNLCT
jgi:hypothetical protein